ncbi:hypothetical protein BMS3Abin07_00984 [bacterium BMS3Abin07]|nr:hypothetical protein BMS3Abin07_00984 [bacterium BMS3Abin07]HDL20324.1 menaquinol oxidoreductase [Nitrospirota bacterium]HDO22687.1 menaquinol oxidoreductase [Nitrospirota bacterium]HDZ89029.1 menaquinol oxidoreductase [Nitrospirota bacterium]
MYDGGKILIGIIIFLAVATFPIYSNFGKVIKKPDPKLDTPVIQKMKVKECVEPKEYMRKDHMQLLISWRDAALRDGDRIYKSTSGKDYHISLQNSCLKCHSNKKKFCDECHNYVSVKPYCWDCHFAKKEEGWK